MLNSIIRRMNSKMIPRHVDEKEWTWTILGMALLLGIFVRLLPALLARFPINDGGMFAVMIRDLRANQLSLPIFTTYNDLHIPFAYPPLGFYLGALFELLGMSELQVMLWLPAFLTVATLPLFYLLAFELLDNRPRAAAATIFFALAPGNYVWYVMGGGLTRALGAAFFILALYFVHRSFKEAGWRSAIFATLFCALTVLSHPQYALLTAMGSAVFWLFSGRARITTLRAFVVASGTLALTSPWWAIVIWRHGVDVFLYLGQSGDLKTALSMLLGGLILRQTIIPIATIFWLLGLGWAVYKRRVDLLLWGFLPYFIDQRSAPIATAFLYPMLAAYGAMDVLPALIDWLRSRKWIFASDDTLFNQRAFSTGLLAVIFYLFIECFFYVDVIRSVTLPDSARSMMTWAKEKTSARDNFLILTGNTDVMTDAVQEWFPALSGRHSVTTLQGLEWTLRKDFVIHWRQLAALQNCHNMSCIDFWTQKMELKYTYIIVDKSAFSVEMFLSKEYKVIFDNGRYAVLK